MMSIAYNDALADVKARVNASRSSFHAGMSILPKARRDAMYALYAFCREVDDIADDGATLESRKAGLQQWREKIAALYRGQITDTITAALAPAVKDYSLFERDFLSVIDGMEMDAGEPICAPDAATFDLYCDRVASAVGRLSIRIFGDAGPAALDVAHHLGRALQKTNVLRDLGEDSERGRLYLPRELLEKHGIVSRVPTEVLKDKNLPAFCRDLAAEAQAHFVKADAAMDLCKPAAMRPARVMRAYYGAILGRLLANNWQDPQKRTTLPKWQKAWIVLKELVSG